MSNTGSYKMIDGKLVKVSDEIPRTIGLATSDKVVGFKKPYWDPNMGDDPVWIKSKSHKAKLLTEKGLMDKTPKNGAWM